MLSTIIAKYKYYLLAAVAAFLIGVGMYIATPKAIKPDMTNELIEVKEKEKIDALKQANEYKAKNDLLEAKNAQAEKDRQAQRLEIARLKALAGASQDSPGQVSPGQDTGQDATEPCVKWKLVVDKQDALINDLSKDYDNIKSQNSLLKLENDSLRKALRASEDQVTVMKIAREAHEAALKSERWQGRKEGAEASIAVAALIKLASVL